MFVVVKKGYLSAHGSICGRGEVVELDAAEGKRLIRSPFFEECFPDFPVPSEEATAAVPEEEKKSSDKGKAAAKKSGKPGKAKETANGLPAPDIKGAASE